MVYIVMWVDIINFGRNIKVNNQSRNYLLSSMDLQMFSDDYERVVALLINL